MTTLTIDIDQRLIDEHGERVDQCFACPCFAWLEEHGLDPAYVCYSYAALEDGRELIFPDEFEKWQKRGSDAVEAEVDPRTVLVPITFETRLTREEAGDL